MNNSGVLKVPWRETVAAWPDARSWRGSGVLLGLILFLSVILTYQAIWHAGYIWDDDLMVTANACVVGPLGLKEIWTTKAADICPLTLTAFWLEHKLWGLAPLPYHLVTVCLHGACAVLLWRVLRGLQVPGAWLGAALWALHPVQVESAAWITEMKNTQSGVFYLLAILFFLRWRRSIDLAGRPGAVWLYAGTLVCAALAVASKSSTVILPAVLCLLAWWMDGRWRRRDLLAAGPIFLVSLAACLLSVWTQAILPTAADVPQFARSWPQRLAVAGDAVWFYLGKLAWPHPLIIVYPQWEVDSGKWTAFLPILAVGLVLLVLWSKRRSWGRCWLLAFGYFLLALLPVLGLVEMAYFHFSFVADHFLYLASMGPLALAGAGAVWLRERCAPAWTWLPPALGAGLALTYGLVSWQRTWVYENAETLWIDTLAKNPHCWVGNYDLGLIFAQRGESDRAMVQYQKALQTNPLNAKARNNLGVALGAKGRFDEAIAQYRQALQINPLDPEAHGNLGAALADTGQLDAAIAEYREALKLNPAMFAAHDDLGKALFQKGQLQEAIVQYQKALKIIPADADAHCNLGTALLQNGQRDEAIVQYEQALKIAPAHGDAHGNLGTAFLQSGRWDEAAAQYEAALKINPRNPEWHCNLGAALAQKGRVAEAIGQFQEALSLRPAFYVAHEDLGKALLQQGHAPEAIAQYQEALKIMPDSADAHFDLGTAFMQSEQWDEAIGQYQETLRINPGQAFAHGNLGVALAKQGRVGEAIAQFQEALRLKADYANARDNLAKLQASLGQSVAP